MFIDKNILQQRQVCLGEKIFEKSLDSIALNPSANLYYLTGLDFHISERPVVAFFMPNSPPSFVLPALEAEKLSNLPYPVTLFPYGEDPLGWSAIFQQAINASGLKPNAKIGVDTQSLRLLEANYLYEVLSQVNLIDARGALAELRTLKTQQEIELMKHAVRIAETSLEQALPLVKVGMTEIELASEIVLQVFRSGSDPKLPFNPIVASGRNGANPHAMPSNRQLSPGDLLVIDWGASFQGYCADLTRTFAISDFNQEQKNVFDIVLNANSTARNILQPGILAEEIDQAARSVIENAGYGQYFIHRTGHGLGIEPHEEPYIYQGNSQKILTGMTFTIEPGIYIPNNFGVRIEDDVVITRDGSETLSTIQRDFKVIG